MHDDATERWVRHYEWLQRYFSHEEANEYAEELTQAGEERQPKIERSPLEIKREMELITHIEASVQAVRVLVGIALFFCTFFLLGWIRSDFCNDRCEKIIESIPKWVSIPVLIIFTFGTIFVANAVSNLRFWKRYLDMLRRKRLQSFWEWRSATLRYPLRHTIYSGDFGRSEPPDADPSQNKPPYLLD